jgi:tetraacyldisaccharide 4'-kinase
MENLELLFDVGRLFSPLYSRLMVLRARLYLCGRLKRHRLPVPVISVGNLTLGGTGKTPLVIFLAKFSQKLGLRPVVISRGYQGSAAGRVNVVSGGERILLSPREAGDEPWQVAKELPGVAVLTGKKRVFPARYAVEELRSDLLILDDGFQHLALDRQLDIVLFNCNKPLGNGRVFPGGPLREPLSALSRADCFMLTGCPDESGDNANAFVAMLGRRFPGKNVFTSHFQLHSVFFHGSARMVPVQQMKGKKVIAFCGLGNPVAFRRDLVRAGFEIAFFQSFADHHRYREADATMLEGLLIQKGADLLLTTEKDYVKLQGFHWRYPLGVAQGETMVDNHFLSFLEHFLRNIPIKAESPSR